MNHWWENIRLKLFNDKMMKAMSWPTMSMIDPLVVDLLYNSDFSKKPAQNFFVWQLMKAMYKKCFSE